MSNTIISTKKVLSTILMAVCILAIPFSSLSAQSTQSATQLTVYSHRHYEADKKLFAQFTEKTGIRIQVLQGEADQLIQRLKNEGERSPADLFITADVGRLYLAQSLGLLQAINSSTLNSAIPAHLRDPKGEWYGLTKRARVFVYDKTNPPAFIPRTYEELADTRLKGKVLIRSSSNVYNISLIAGLLGHWGKEKTLAWAKGLVANLAQAPQGGDRDQMKALAAGKGTIAITNTYYIGQLLTSQDAAERAIGARMAVVFPGQNDIGTHINVSGAGVTKSSKNLAAAQLLLEYLVSPEAQEIFAAENHEYPVRLGTKLSASVQQWGNFKEDSQALEVLGRLSPDALRISDEAGWK